MSKSYQAEITMNHFYYLLFVAEFTFAYDMIVEINTNLFVRLKNNTGHILKSQRVLKILFLVIFKQTKGCLVLFCGKRT